MHNQVTCGFWIHDGRLMAGMSLSFLERAAIVRNNPPRRCGAPATGETEIELDDGAAEMVACCDAHR